MTRYYPEKVHIPPEKLESYNRWIAEQTEEKQLHNKIEVIK